MADTTKQARKHSSKNCKFCGDLFVPMGSTQIYCKTCVPNRKAGQRAAIFGISQVEYDRLLETQNRTCAVCQYPLNLLTSRQVVIDHCHVTDVVRGVVCIRCNILLGAIDEAGWIERAKAYVGGPGLMPLWKRGGNG